MNGRQGWAIISVLGALLLVSAEPVEAQGTAYPEPMQAADPEEVWFGSGDLMLHGYLYRPEGPGPFPAVLFSHGGGAREPRPAYRELAPFFVRAGYLFFAPERRGRGESPGEYVEELPMRQSGAPNWSRLRAAAIEVEQYDAYDALAYLHERPEVDTNRILLAGWSTGAILSILGVEEDRGLRGAIAMAVTPNLWNQSSHVRERVSEAAGRATTPLLLIHADDDVGAVSTRALVEVLEQKNLPYRAYVHPPAGLSAADAHPFCALHRVEACWPVIASFLGDVLGEAESLPRSEVPQAVIDDLAPTGVLRVALGLGNAVVATRDPDTGEVRGLAMDLLPELAARLGVPFATFEFVPAEEAIQAIEAGVWDVGFVPVGSPLPADEEWLSKLDVTAPLVEFENTYLVADASPIKTHADADQPGQRIVVVAGTSTEGFLSRMLEHAELITVPGRPAALELLASGQVDAWAGTPFALQPLAPRLPGAVMLEGSFASNRVGLGIPRGRPVGLQYVSEFAEDLRASGRVQEALDRNPLPGVQAVP